MSLNESLNALVPTKYDAETGKPMWKDEGADTWNFFSAYDIRTGSFYASSSTVSFDCGIVSPDFIFVSAADNWCYYYIAEKLKLDAYRSDCTNFGRHYGGNATDANNCFSLDGTNVTLKIINTKDTFNWVALKLK